MAAAAVPELAGKQLLVVEDEALLSMEMDYLLSSYGCEVLACVATIPDALACLDQAQPDLVLLDLNLNGHPTTQVAEHLSSRQIPFVIVSGYGHQLYGDPILGSALRVEKPFSEADLVQKMMAALG